MGFYWRVACFCISRFVKYTRFSTMYMICTSVLSVCTSVLFRFCTNLWWNLPWCNHYVSRSLLIRSPLKDITSWKSEYCRRQSLRALMTLLRCLLNKIKPWKAWKAVLVSVSLWFILPCKKSLIRWSWFTILTPCCDTHKCTDFRRQCAQAI